MSRRPREPRSDAKSTLGKIALQQRFVPADGLRSGTRRREIPPVPPPFSQQLAAMVFSDNEQQRAASVGLPPLCLRKLVIGTGVTRMVPLELARDYGILAVDLSSPEVSVAVSEPPTRAQLDEFEFLLGRALTCYLVPAADLVVAIEGVYAANARGEATYVMEPSEADESEPTTGEVPAIGVAQAPAPVPVHDIVQASAEPSADAGREQGEPAVPPPELPPAAALEAVPVGQEVTEGPVVKLDPAFSEPPRPLEHASAPDLAGKRLLVGGLGSDVVEALRGSLGKQGLAFTVCSDGKEILQAVLGALPSALLLDTELHGVHGLEAIRRVREAHPAGELPILVVSRVHHGWRFAADLNLNFGIEHFFEMPLELARLQRALRCTLLGEDLCDVPEELGQEAAASLRDGMAAFERGDLDGAIESLEAGDLVAPGTFQLEYHLGLLYGRRGDFFCAMAALEQAAHRKPRHFSALKNLAVVYQRAGFRHKATETWERAMWNAPDDDTRATIKEHMLRLL